MTKNIRTFVEKIAKKIKNDEFSEWKDLKDFITWPKQDSKIQITLTEYTIKLSLVKREKKKDFVLISLTEDEEDILRQEFNEFKKRMKNIEDETKLKWQFDAISYIEDILK